MRNVGRYCVLGETKLTANPLAVLTDARELPVGIIRKILRSGKFCNTHYTL